jgi:hypothetical protein
VAREGGAAVAVRVGERERGRENDGRGPRGGEFFGGRGEGAAGPKMRKEGGREKKKVFLFF